MPVILFKLNGVPEDEAAEVREILQQNHIDYYETSAGNWAVSLAAIWLRDDTQLALARSLIDEYQLERRTKARDMYEKSGDIETMLTRIIQNPVRALFYLIAVVVLLYLSIKPFFTFGHS